jgi:hypothetical protein
VNVVLPRLDRVSAERLIAQYRHEPLTDLSANMPDLTAPVTYAAVGGARVERVTLERLRTDLLHLGADHGMPGPIREVSVFEGHAAQLIRHSLPMTPHEASQEEVWSYLTCCWLLDIAIWRFGGGASDDRFIGHINRNTFRRMWWREEILGVAINLTQLGEDELVNIMERPTLYVDARLAHAIAREFLTRVQRGDASDRMRLMREATKRLLRLTPFLAFNALADAQVNLVVADAFDAALAGLAGNPAVMPPRTSDPRLVPDVSPDVTDVPVLAVAESVTVRGPSAGRHVMEFEEVARAAIEVARRTGRVTNTTLREVAPITSDEAREIFQYLIGRKELVRRGTKRGTHYVIPEGQPDETDGRLGAPDEHDRRSPVEARTRERSSEAALRHLLRRTR